MRLTPYLPDGITLTAWLASVTNSHAPATVGTKTVNEAAIGDGKTLVYRTATGQLGYEVGGGGSGDMTKAVYDTDDDGVVDAAEDSARLGGSLPAAYAPAGHTHAGVYAPAGQTLLVGYIPMTYSYKGNAVNTQVYVYTAQDKMGRVCLNADACNAAFGAGAWVLYVEGLGNSNFAGTNLFARITKDTAVAPGSGTRLTGAAAADELSCALTANGADYANLLSAFSIGPFSGALPAAGGEALSVAFRNDQAAKTHYYVDVRVVARLAP